MIRTEGLGKRFRMGDTDVHALSDVTLSIAAGEAVAIMGSSGSGKSTLMTLLGCLDRPSSGRYLLNGEDIGRLSRARLAQVRNSRIGFVFQNFNLLARASALENVELPLVYAGMGGRERRRRAREMLEAVGIADRAHHHPAQLSGGQQQRVAVARALAGKPDILLADEPTGALDSRTSDALMLLLSQINAQGVTLVVITHDPAVADSMPRVITLKDGRMQSDERTRPVPRLVVSGR
jgi:putative ABC transport system ATP-binding protein